MSKFCLEFYFSIDHGCMNDMTHKYSTTTKFWPTCHFFVQKHFQLEMNAKSIKNIKTLKLEFMASVFILLVDTAVIIKINWIFKMGFCQINIISQISCLVPYKPTLRKTKQKDFTDINCGLNNMIKKLGDFPFQFQYWWDDGPCQVVHKMLLSLHFSFKRCQSWII